MKKLAKAIVESVRKPMKKIKRIDSLANIGEKWMDRNDELPQLKDAIEEYKKLGSAKTKQGRTYRRKYMMEKYGE